MKAGALVRKFPSPRLLSPHLNLRKQAGNRHIMSTGAAPDRPATPLDAPKAKTPSLTMQIILRRDLLDVEKWPVGPLIAQGSHAATALMHLYKDHQAMKDYTEDWKHMRKVSRLRIPLVRAECAAELGWDRLSYK